MIGGRIAANHDVLMWWCNKVPKKVNMFIWRASYIPVRIQLQQRGLELESFLCVLCSVIAETTYHVLVCCMASTEVWRSVRAGAMWVYMIFWISFMSPRETLYLKFTLKLNKCGKALSTLPPGWIGKVATASSSKLSNGKLLNFFFLIYRLCPTLDLRPLTAWFSYK